MVIEMEIVIDLFSCFTWTLVFIQIYFFIFDGAPEAFGYNIIKSSTLSIHTNFNFLICTRSVYFEDW